MSTKTTRQRICVRLILSLLLALCLLAGPLLMASPARAQGPEYNWWGSILDYDESLDVGDPIAASNGSYHFTMPLLDLGGPMGLHFSLIYRSDFMQMSGPFLPADFLHHFWWSPKYSAVFVGPGDIGGDVDVWTIQMANGNTVSFKKVGDEWVLPGPTDFGYENNGSAVRYVLKETTDYLYLMDPIAGCVHIFEKVTIGLYPFNVGRIVRVVDRNGNQLIYTYAADDENNPIRIEDGLGRSLDLTYGGSLTQVTDQAGRQVSFAFDNGGDNGGFWTLRSVTDPLGQTTTFTYTTVQDPYNPFNIYFDNVVSVAHPLGNIPYTQAYDAPVLDGLYTVRVMEQTDAYGNTTTLTYDPNQNQVTEDRPDENTVVYQHHSNNSLPKSLTDAVGNTVDFGKNDNEQMTSVTDRLDGTTAFDYHAETGNLASITNSQGNVISYTYAAQTQIFTNSLAITETVTFTFYNRTRIDYTDDTNEQFTYDAKGNMLTRVDRSGKTWTYTYNDKGQVLTIANPLEGVITYTYNADGTTFSSTDSDIGTIMYGYDDYYKRRNRTTYPDGSFTQTAYDLNDQITSTTDENNHTYTYTYDANGNLVKAT
nr:RHS repeat protein [Anaerolineales bacterium]